MQFIFSLRNALIIAGLAAGTTTLAQAQAPAARPAGPPPPPLGKPRKHYMLAQKDPACASVANLTKNTDEDAEVTGTYTQVCYRSNAEMLLEINELRKIHDWADSTYSRRLAALPPGGALVLTIHRQGAKNADPSYLYISAQTKDGKEFFNATPRPGTGRFFGRDLYQHQQVIPFAKTDITGPVMLIINDTRLRQLFEYSLTLPVAQ